MIPRAVLVACTVLVLGAFPAGAQSLKDAVRMMTPAEYESLLLCTVSRNADASRAYAEFQLDRLPRLAPDRADADPHSSAWIRALDGCHQIVEGQQLPFNLQRLVEDWITHFNLLPSSRAGNMSLRESAKCFVAVDRRAAKAFLRAPPKGRFAHIPLLAHAGCKVDDSVLMSPRNGFENELRLQLQRNR
jgi:hypothetical protein